MGYRRGHTKFLLVAGSGEVIFVYHFVVKVLVDLGHGSFALEEIEDQGDVPALEIGQRHARRDVERGWIVGWFVQIGVCDCL